MADAPSGESPLADGDATSRDASHPSSLALEVKIGHSVKSSAPDSPGDAFSMESFAAPSAPPSRPFRCCGAPAQVEIIDCAPPPTAALIPAPLPEDEDKICLVVDLDETLIHSSFSLVPGAELTFSFSTDKGELTVSVKVRPGAREFLAELAPLYEIVVFTASVKPYADVVVDYIDPNRVVKYRLYRDSCTEMGGSWVKDLSRLNRNLEKVIIVDNSPAAYLLHPYNAIPISSWYDDPGDAALAKLLFFLRHSYRVRNIYDLLGSE
jgi:RNA polymerase II subunit A small phosphatase-like protein